MISTLLSLALVGTNLYSDTQRVDTPLKVSTSLPSMDHKVITRVKQSPVSTALKQTKAQYAKSSINENIAVVVERVLNKDSMMLKKGTVQPVGTDLSTWKLLCDEGGNTYEQSSPNPLSYFTTGIASNLLTQLQRSAKVMGMDIKTMKVEAKVFFRYDAPMTKEWAGYTDKVIANILIDSKESPEKLAKMKSMAFKGWVAGEGLANKTEILPELVINGNHWDTKYSLKGNVPNPVSVDTEMTLSQKTASPQPSTFELGAELDMEKLNDPTEFAVVAIVESANNPDRPYLQKINVRAIQENYVGWELYADDSYQAKGSDKAPTSLDYLTAGTGFCLTTQVTANNMFLKLDVNDYRIEQQINYRQENFMTSDMTGYTDSIITKILINSNAPKEELKKYSTMALRSCFAGEAFMNETPIESNLYLNGKIIK